MINHLLPDNFNRRFVRMFPAALVCLLIGPILINWTKLKNHCINGYDFGIYYQALLEISIPDQLNPHLSVRGIPAFNDHFNPVLVPISWFLKLFGSLTPYHALVFEWLAWVSGFLMFMFLLRRESPRIRWSAAFLFLLTKGFLTALYFPIHVDFWSLPFWVLLAWSLFQNRWGLFLLSAVGICFFKESYPIAFLFTAIALLLTKRWKVGLPLLLVALAFTVWNLKLRPLFLGPIHGHGTNILRMIFETPDVYFRAWWERFPVLGSIEVYLIPFYFLVSALKKKPQAGLYLASCLAPLFGLQILAGLMEFHYAFPIAAAGLGAAAGSGVFQNIFEASQSTRRLRFAIFALVLIPGLSQNWNAASFLWSLDTNCQVLPEKLTEFTKLQQLIADQESQARQEALSAIAIPDPLKLSPVIGASGGLIPWLIAPNRDLRQLLSHAIIPPTYDLLAIEVGPIGHPYPLNPDRVAKVLKDCSPFIQEKLLEGSTLILWKGNFPASCIYQWPSPAVNAADYPISNL